MTYVVESERMTEVRRGPFGILRKLVPESLPLGTLNNGQNIELVSRGGQRWGMAKLTEDVLEVTPEGDVVVDMGNYRGFQSQVEIPTADGTIIQKIWVGSLKTNGDLTVRTADSKESIKFRPQ